MEGRKDKLANLQTQRAKLEALADDADLEKFFKDNANTFGISGDEKTIDATVFAISQIGELVKNISKETIKKYNNIEWNMIKGLRNRIVHDYDGISLKSIWFVLENDLEQLKEDIQMIIDDDKKEKQKDESSEN